MVKVSCVSRKFDLAWRIESVISPFLSRSLKSQNKRSTRSLDEVRNVAAGYILETDPIPEFIMKNNLRTLGLGKDEFLSLLENQE